MNRTRKEILFEATLETPASVSLARGIVDHERIWALSPDGAHIVVIDRARPPGAKYKIMTRGPELESLASLQTSNDTPFQESSTNAVGFFG